MVPEVDEQEAAMVADAVRPAGKPDRLADIGLAEGGTGVAAVAVHGVCFLASDHCVRLRLSP